MRGKEEIIKINGISVHFSYHIDWSFGEQKGFWRADTS